MIISGKNEKTVTIKLNTVTPVFIGSGKSFTANKDFISNSRGCSLDFVNQKNLEQLIYEKNLFKKYCDHLSMEKESLNQWLLNQKLHNKEFLKKLGIRTAIAKIKNENANGIDSVAAFIRDVYGKPYIPGTSLKGAMNNVLKCHFLINSDSEKDQTYFEKKRQEIKNVFENSDNEEQGENEVKQVLTQLGDELDAYLEQRLFSSFNTKSLLPSPILIGDSNHVEESQLAIYQKHDYVLNKKKDKKEVWLPLYRECLSENTRFNIQGRFDFDRIAGIGCVEDLKNALRVQRQLLLANDGIYSEFSSEIDRFIPKINEDHESAILIFLGGGAGFHTKTLLAALFNNDDAFQSVTHNILNMVKSRDEEDFAPHTIKLANKKIMGICKLDLKGGDNA
ncbi:type III-A CRISPR-associated RAMP protein Csm5 [Eubacterium limosum]|uniref:type III-A CRISPR-associated RAMP protein Csm5 n=1 Tax=Eubacterium limosum TaxID=1736 RepID=UPI00370FF903